MVFALGQRIKYTPRDGRQQSGVISERIASGYVVKLDSGKTRTVNDADGWRLVVERGKTESSATAVPRRTPSTSSLTRRGKTLSIEDATAEADALESALAEFDAQIAALEPEVTEAEAAAGVAEIGLATKTASFLIQYSSHNDELAEHDTTLLALRQTIEEKRSENIELARRGVILEKHDRACQAQIESLEASLTMTSDSRSALEKETTDQIEQMQKARDAASIQSERFVVDVARLEKARLRLASFESAASMLLEAETTVADALAARAECERFACARQVETNEDVAAAVSVLLDKVDMDVRMHECTSIDRSTFADCGEVW